MLGGAKRAGKDEMERPEADLEESSASLFRVPRLRAGACGISLKPCEWRSQNEVAISMPWFGGIFLENHI